MLKYISAPDLHFNPAWLSTSVQIFKSIIKAARDNQVDFVALPGDLYDTAILATDKGGINEVIAFVRELSHTCPIISVQGTLSHDAPGSYGPLSEWVTLLEPGKMYGLRSDNRVIQMRANNINRADAYQCVLFGIPEITKETYIADNPTTDAGAANGAILALIDALIDNEIAPIRALMPNVPAIGLLHGNVSDCSDRAFETDNILKRSDIVIKTDTLARAGLTRWELGHIHTPWESRKVSAGYAGFAGIDLNPWGKTGFVPSMNLVDIDDAMTPTISRVAYGTPMRVKITAPLESYDPAVAYWLEASDASQQLPADGIHPWSRRTDAETTAVSRRVDTEELEQAKTLTDLARLFDPDITPEVAACFDEIEKTVKHIDTPPRMISIDRVRVKGCILFGDDTVDADVSHFAPGLTQLAGENGTGKSSAVGWMTPYPCFIGKNTDSGRQSAIKDFFSAPDSGIEKWITFNGQSHHHLITIKGAHTKTPKTEYFFEINGVPVQEKTLTFDEMMTECETRYGSVDDYLKTSFYVQPLQGPFESGLMTATMTTIRDLVQGIAGVDRSQEKRYALDKTDMIGKTVDRRKIEIETMRAGIKNPEEVKRLIDERKASRLVYETALSSRVAELDVANNHLVNERARAAVATEAATRRSALETVARNAQAEIDAKTRRSDELARLTADVHRARTALEADDVVKTAYSAALVKYNEAERENVAIRAENDRRAARIRELEAKIDGLRRDATSRHESAVSAWRLEVARIGNIDRENAAIAREIALIEKPCPECGYVDPDVAARVAALRARVVPVPALPIEPVAATVVIPPETSDEYDALLFADCRVPIMVTLPSQGLADAERSKLRATVDAAASYTAERELIERETIPSLTARRDDATREASTINVAPVDLATAETAARDADKAVNAVRSLIADSTATIAALERQSAEIEDATNRLDKIAVEVENLVSSLTAWKRVDAMLAPPKIPAMELDAVLDGIDREATKRIGSYRDGRYYFQTVTKDGEIDRFDIIVADKYTGRAKSFLKHSVGEKSFLNAAYTWALVKIRKQRMKTEYAPVILDESDSFIGLKDLPSYYEMQSAYFDETGGKCVVITHSPEAGAFILNHVDMEEIKK